MRTKEIDEIKLKERYKKQLERQNNYSKQKYDHLSVILPKGYKDLITSICSKNGYKSPSEYLKTLLNRDKMFSDALEENQEQQPDIKKLN